jgi:hypothetical protein
MNRFIEGFVEQAISCGVPTHELDNLLKAAAIMHQLQTSPAFVQGMQESIDKAAGAMDLAGNSIASKYVPPRTGAMPVPQPNPQTPKPNIWRSALRGARSGDVLKKYVPPRTGAMPVPQPTR